MATSGSVSWDVCERCAADGGIGVRLPSGGSCWAHANDQDLDAALKRLGEDGHLDARGVPLTQDLLERLLAAAPGSDRRQVVLADARFYAAIFQGKANFNNVTFQGNAGFAMATFRGMALFDEVTFQGNAGFEQAQFNGRGWFGEAQFEGNAGFEETVFQADAIFNEAIFQGEARFSEARFSAGTGFARVTFQSFAWFGGATFHHTGFNGTTFQRDARFSEATFQGYAGFREVAFQRDARFREATFQDDAEFNGATFQRDAWFVGATFERARQLGPMLVRKALVLDQAVFRERVQIEVAAAAVCCRRGRFPAGVQLRVRWAQVVLDDADLAAPSILSGVPSFPDLDEGRWARAVERLLPQPRFKSELRSRPRLLSIRRADVAGLTVAAVDLRACRFVGAHHIDQLRVEESSLGYTPRGWRWTTRLTIAEERYWRANVHRDGTSLPDDHATNVVDRRSGTAGHDGDWACVEVGAGRG